MHSPLVQIRDLCAAAAHLYEQKQYAQALHGINEALRLGQSSAAMHGHYAIAHCLTAKAWLLTRLELFDDLLTVEIAADQAALQLVVDDPEHALVAFQQLAELATERLDERRAYNLWQEILAISATHHGTDHPRYSQLQMRRLKFLQPSADHPDTAMGSPL